MHDMKTPLPTQTPDASGIKQNTLVYELNMYNKDFVRGVGGRKTTWVSKLHLRLGFPRSSIFRVRVQLVELLVITDSLIPRRSCQLTAAWVQSHSYPLLVSLHRLQNLSGLVLLRGIAVDPIKRADGAIASWKDE